MFRVIFDSGAQGTIVLIRAAVDLAHTEGIGALTLTLRALTLTLTLTLTLGARLR